MEGIKEKKERKKKYLVLKIVKLRLIRKWRNKEILLIYIRNIL